MNNQQDPDTRKKRHEHGQQHESSLSAFCGTEPAQRQALAAQVYRQWAWNKPLSWMNERSSALVAALALQR